jgi:peptidoglycan/LPS O-acetylase OafA/YrhL
MGSLTTPVSAGAPGNRKGYLIQLDGLRAFAAFAVLVQHSLPPQGVNIGGLGVKLFFVLSGFLITGILIRERGCGESGAPVRKLLSVFYARRFLRIFPLFYAALALAVLFQIPRIMEALPWHLTYTSNLMIARGTGTSARAAPPCRTSGLWPWRSSSTWSGPWWCWLRRPVT